MRCRHPRSEASVLIPLKPHLVQSFDPPLLHFSSDPTQMTTDSKILTVGYEKS
ncbi:hypothetical protein Hanom_Chr03g00230461 [Helianthus anomalus]